MVGGDSTDYGSSPLARGLHAVGHDPRPCRRIIPARAGFTTLISRWLAISWDHPRSRGVYGDRPNHGGHPPGSSPLARGLPIPKPKIEYKRGIIPARAGFTRRHRGRPSRNPDHPRSRGVYTSRALAHTGYVGSSPLARGLPHRPAARANLPRIIPARAGFTTYNHTSCIIIRDHPRSRGVYISPPSPAPSRRGSSPLARGLLVNASLRGKIVRIIPARAGFTKMA